MSNSKLRILIIDDDNAVLRAHERLLERAGHEVRVSAGAFEGLDITRDWQPDLILLDLLMPAVSGLEAVRVFRKKPWTRDAILVAFSGVVEDEEVERYRRLGFDEILPKPVGPHMLAARIDAIVARRRRLVAATDLRSGGGQDTTRNGYSMRRRAGGAG